jgi:hypothetical protein
MKALLFSLMLLSLLVLPISITAEDYDPEYWENVGDSIAVENGWDIWYGPIHRRIASRWTMTVKCDTVVDSVVNRRSHEKGGYKLQTWSHITCDTSWTKKLPVYLDSAQNKALMRVIKDEMDRCVEHKSPGTWIPAR